MKFSISKQQNGWVVRPLSGEFEGKVVATAEGVCMRGVVFEGRTVQGALKALWGAVVTVEEVYDDMQTLLNLRIGGTFDQGDAGQDLSLDYDGWVNRLNKACKKASRLQLLGDKIVVSGATW
jgi:hypothetical protein